MILPIYVYGHPVLRKPSIDINSSLAGLEELIDNMFETLLNSEGIGLAAPQIGRNIRVVVIDLDQLKDSFTEYKGFHKVYINGHIIERDNSSVESMEEGCLSLPGIRENVTRAKRVRVKYLDRALQAHDEWIDGYLARVIQHEFDHLDATLFIDRISPLRRQLIKGKLRSILQGRYKCSYSTRGGHH